MNERTTTFSLRPGTIMAIHRREKSWTPLVPHMGNLEDPAADGDIDCHTIIFSKTSATSGHSLSHGSRYGAHLVDRSVKKLLSLLLRIYL